MARPSEAVRYLCRLMHDNGARLRHSEARSWWVDVGNPWNEFHPQWPREALNWSLLCEVDSSAPGERHYLLTDAGRLVGQRAADEYFAALDAPPK